MWVCKKCGGRIYEQLQLCKGTKKFICPSCGATSSNIKDIAKNVKRLGKNNND